MRKEAAFTFIPELIGDISHVMEMSGNPKLLYIETAVNTLHTVADVFRVVEEHGNTERKKATEQALRESYAKLQNDRKSNLREEEIHKLDILYDSVKSKLRDGQFRDKEVKTFIELLKSDLQRVIEVFKEIQQDPDYPEHRKVEELTRRTFRDYNRLLKIYIEEEEKDGED